MNLSYEQGMAMARVMKREDEQIKTAIGQVQRARHGVVALRFSEQGTEMEIEILDEPYDANVRLYPGE